MTARWTGADLSRALVVGFVLVASTGFLAGFDRAIAVESPGWCEISVEPRLTLEDSTGVYLVEPPLVLFADGGGRFWLSSQGEPSRIQIFAPSGRLDRSIGRRGQGPGEFQMITAGWADPSGGARILDAGNARITYLADRGEVLDTHPTYPLVPHDVELVIPPDGAPRMLLSALLRDPERIGQPIHVMTDNGRHERSFGRDPPAFRPDRPHEHWRRLAALPSGGDEFLVAHVARYRVERRSLTGELRGATEIELDWFPAGDHIGFLPGEPRQPPAPGIMGMAALSEARALILVRRAREGWEAGLGERPDPLRGGTVATIEDEGRVWLYELHLVDLEGGTLLATTELPDRTEGFLRSSAGEPHQVIVLRSDALGLRHVELHSVHIHCEGAP